MLTIPSRRDLWLPKAIECFRKQTYANKQLLIVADHDPHTHDRYLAEATIALVGDAPHAVIVGRYSNIGTKRNAGCSNAHGDIVCHFDDDDYSAPDRISDQVATLQRTGKAVTGYMSMPFVNDKGEWWRYRGNPGYVLGTSLCYRRDWWVEHTFSPINIQEDLLFVNEALKYRQIECAPDAGLMYATTHATNTSTRDHNINGQSTWERMHGFAWQDK